MIAIITGASSGLGKEFAIQLDNKGYDEIWIIARRLDRLQELAIQLKTKTIAIQADLTKQEGIQFIITKLKKENPNIKLLINNAGCGKKGKFKYGNKQQFLDIIDLNVKSLVELTFEALPYMKNSKIIQVSSVAGYMPLPGNAIYAASKAFVLNFTTALNAELKDIHVMALCPGPVNTEFFKLWGGKEHDKKRASSQQVVRKALKDLDRNKWVSTYGIKMKASKLLGKLLPRKWTAKMVAKKPYSRDPASQQ